MAINKESELGVEGIGHRQGNSVLLRGSLLDETGSG
jgi:hypothetical protein